MALDGTRKADRVAEDLLRRITRGDLAVGDLLPKESDLAAEFGVNRSVVREAIKQLEAHRVVRPIKRRGTEVLDPLRSSSADVLRAMLEPRPGSFDRQTLAELTEVRATLDVEMTALACARRTDDDLRAMDAIVADLRTALGQPDRYAALMSELSLATAQATQNRIYVMMVHWHHHVRGAADPLSTLVRLANETHLAGVEHLVDLVRRREAAQARDFVRAVHDWIIPHILDAAALAEDAPVPETQIIRSK